MGTQPAANPGDNVMGASLRWVAPSALKWCQRVTVHLLNVSREQSLLEVLVANAKVAAIYLQEHPVYLVSYVALSLRLQKLRSMWTRHLKN